MLFRSTRLQTVRVGGVELVSWGGELVDNHVAEIGQVFEALAKDFGCAHTVCDLLVNVWWEGHVDFSDWPHVWILKCKTASEGWGME
jgi:hypothetical protein